MSWNHGTHTYLLEGACSFLRLQGKPLMIRDTAVPLASHLLLFSHIGQYWSFSRYPPACLSSRFTFDQVAVARSMIAMILKRKSRVLVFYASGNFFWLGSSKKKMPWTSLVLLYPRVHPWIFLEIHVLVMTRKLGFNWVLNRCRDSEERRPVTCIFFLIVFWDFDFWTLNLKLVFHISVMPEPSPCHCNEEVWSSSRSDDGCSRLKYGYFHRI